jgi:hypothetical protein
MDITCRFGDNFYFSLACFIGHFIPCFTPRFTYLFTHRFTSSIYPSDCFIQWHFTHIYYALYLNFSNLFHVYLIEVNRYINYSSHVDSSLVYTLYSIPQITKYPPLLTCKDTGVLDCQTFSLNVLKSNKSVNSQTTAPVSLQHTPTLTPWYHDTLSPWHPNNSMPCPQQYKEKLWLTPLWQQQWQLEPLKKSSWTPWPHSLGNETNLSYSCKTFTFTWR